MKYLHPEDISFTTEGTVKIGGLQGAILLPSDSTMRNNKEEMTSNNNNNSSTSSKKKKVSIDEEELWSSLFPHRSYAVYTAPEVLFGESPSLASNLYCLGMIISLLVTGRSLIKVRHCLSIG